MAKEEAETEKQHKALKKQKRAAMCLTWSLFFGFLSMPFLLFSLFTGFVAGSLIFSSVIVTCGVIFLNTITRPVGKCGYFSTRYTTDKLDQMRKETSYLTQDHKNEEYGQEENTDRSVYDDDPTASQEDYMEEDVVSLERR